MRHLYVHVPFCPTICPYCDFHALLRSKDAVAGYLERLEVEAAALYQRYSDPLRTLYLGGGTPSFLRDSELERIFAILPWRLAADAEVTLEANPATLSKKRLQHLRRLGVNRLSIGVQSFDDAVLLRLGRAHKSRAALTAVESALEGGFRVSLDLMLGLPGQNVSADLETASALGVGHVSAYTLQIETGTPFALNGIRTDRDEEAEAFLLARRILQRAGLVRYEVSNYARPGEESQHNLAYWRMNAWGGLGPAAASHFFGGSPGVVSRRLTNPPLPRWRKGEPPFEEKITPLEHVKEALMMGLRTSAGVDLKELAQRTRLRDLELVITNAAEQAVSAGYLRRSGVLLRPSHAGLDRLHQVVISLWQGLESAYSEP